MTSIDYDQLDGKILEDIEDIEKKCMQMMYVKEFKYLLKLNNLKALDGSVLKDNSVLHPCGFLSMTFYNIDKFQLFKDTSNSNSDIKILNPKNISSYIPESA